MDIERLERAHRDSLANSDREALLQGNLLDELELLFEGIVNPDLALEEILTPPPKMADTKDQKHDSCSEDSCQKFFQLKLKFLHAVMAFVLAYVGIQQAVRPDAAVWVVSENGSIHSVDCIMHMLEIMVKYTIEKMQRVICDTLEECDNNGEIGV